LFELRRLLRHEPFDVLHAHSRGTLPIAMAEAVLGPRELVSSNRGASDAGRLCLALRAS
jgi:hypothetical protein